MPRSVLISLSLALAVLPMAACHAVANIDGSGGGGDDRPGVAASGTGDTRSWPIAGFTGVGLGTAGDVEVHAGKAFSVTATGPSAALDTLKLNRDGSMLKIERKRGVHFDHGEKIRFVVTMPRIAEADIGGSGNIVIDRVDGGAFEGNIGGSGNLDIASMAVPKASFAIGGSGDVKAAGQAQALSISVGGSGKFLLQPLSAETASITIAGSGDVRATVHRSADVTIVGAGDVTIAGGAKCSVTKMGSGNVRCS